MDFTPNLNLPIPNADAVPPKNISAQFPDIAIALTMLDEIIHTLQGAVAGKAETEHTQAISTIIGLTEALASKMPANASFSLDSLTDVQGAADALVNYVLVKKPTGQWEPSTALAALGIHNHAITEVVGLTEQLLDILTALDTLAATKAPTTHAHALSDITGLSAALSSIPPAGATMAFAMNSAPTGWLKANGALVSRTSYAALFAAIGTTFGAGDGSTTFALPDLRGEFVRGWDDGRGVDTGRALGAAQASSIASHRHTYQSTRSDSGAQSGNTTSDNHIPQGGSPPGTVTYPLLYSSYEGGSETRPRNVALLYCIKF